MSKRSDYSELVAKAEAAVASVKDPELKRVAFQKILDDLLASGTSSAGRKASAPPRMSSGRETSKESKRAGPQAYVEEIVAEGFFKKPKTIAQVKAELENRGHHIPLTSLSGPLQKLCRRKVLRRQKAKTSGKKQTFAYSRW